MKPIIHSESQIDCRVYVKYESLIVTVSKSQFDNSHKALAGGYLGIRKKPMRHIAPYHAHNQQALYGTNSGVQGLINRPQTDRKY